MLMLLIRRVVLYQLFRAMLMPGFLAAVSVADAFVASAGFADQVAFCCVS